VGIGALLVLGIGDTVRVSLTGDPVSEIAVARDILRAADKLPGAVELISCPTCGRCRGNLAETAALLSGLVREFENSRIREIKRLISEGKEPPKSMTSVLRAAVMGCEVNGPGEAKNADVGVALTKDKAVYFEKGKKIATVGVREIPRIVMDGLGSLHVYAKSTEYCEES
jgi:(E)-4-hydroxy-3-methylbut-2-enyl-diphosphate synthase